VLPEHVHAANEKASKQGSFAEVPVIDFAPFYTGQPEARAELGAKLFAAMKDIGFVTIINHNLPTDLNKKAFEMSAKFFTSLPSEQKHKYDWVSPESNRGYLCMGQERLDGGLPDIKETFEIGNDKETTFANMWPNEELPEFRTTMLQYFSAADQVHLDVLRCLAIAMNLGEEFFTPLCNGNHQNLRLLHYPECQRSKISASGQKRGGVHSDYGSITLLTQWADQGGLEACRRDGEWIFVPPIEGGIIVNIADCLMRWSNNVLRSTPHRVLDDPRKRDGPTVAERYSIAFFCNPNKEVLVDCIPGCSSETNPAKYKPINAFDYLVGRLSGTIDDSIKVE
jgi:isopenicillin N synthase-like dioxygenase